MRTNLRIIVILALLGLERLSAQSLPPPATGGSVEIEVSSGSESLSRQDDYLPARPYTILAETIGHSIGPWTVQTFTPGAAGSVTSTFIFAPGFAAEHPEIEKPIRGVDYVPQDSDYRYRKIELETVWDSQGQPSFKLTAAAETDPQTYLIEGRGEGKILGLDSFSDAPSALPRPMFHVGDVTDTEGKVAWFAWSEALRYRHLRGINNYWTALQPDGAVAVFHTRAYDLVAPTLGEFRPIGIIASTGTPGRRSRFDLAVEPLTEGQAYDRLREASWDFTGEVLPTAEASAHYAFTPNGASANKLRYRLQIQPGLARTITWMETFTPEGASEPTDRRFLSEAVTAEATQTQAYTLDPFARAGNQPGRYQVVAFESDSFDATLTADTSGDGKLLSASGPMTDHVIANADTVSATQPYRLLANDDDDDGDDTADSADTVVNGADDLADFSPVFLNIKSLLAALPPGVVCKLSQADGALNFVYTDLKQSNAFSFREDTRDHGYGPDFDRPVAEAPVQPITADGVELTPQFLDRIRNQNQGVILIEARFGSTAPLVLTAETGTGTALVSLPLQTFSLGLAVDANRDGQIKLPSEDASDATSATAPYRFWLNDDDDNGDEANQGSVTGNSDEPGRLSGWFEFDGRTPDHEHAGVDGRCDLIDFFPVYLDLKQLLTVLPPDSSLQYKLKQEDEALNFVYTDLTRETAFDYLNKEVATYGNSFNKLPHEAETVAISAEGVALSTAFLDKIKNGASKGVLLLEGAKASDKPLVLSVEKADGTVITEVKLHLKIGEVEKMYRWINLRAEAGQGETRATSTVEPENYPDSTTNGKMFVFVHGYNVNERQSRAWNAEAFKRLYQSGSRAMFTAVTWHGDHSQIPLIGLSPDYWENITNAFATAPFLATAVDALPGSTKVIAGHSMGNMVVTSAIKDHGMNAYRYFMLNAAVALEAYDASAMSISAMTHPDWSMYNARLWATEWHQLFDAGDGRRALTWRDRFGDLPNAINFYSSGEDVLNNNNATPGQVPGVGGERAWVLQEMVKGTQHIGAVLTFDSQGGWGFNGTWDIAETVTNPGPHGSTTTTTYRRQTPAEANLLTPEQLKTQPFFRRFEDARLMGASGSTAAAEYLTRATALGTAIPALSFAAGRNPVPLFNVDQRNIDLVNLQDGWPQTRLADPAKRFTETIGRWFHSDLKNVAYRYNYLMWENLVQKGALK